MPRKWRGNGGGRNQNCAGDYIKSDLERMKELETADKERS